MRMGLTPLALDKRIGTVIRVLLAGANLPEDIPRGPLPEINCPPPGDRGAGSQVADEHVYQVVGRTDPTSRASECTSALEDLLNAFERTDQS